MEAIARQPAAAAPAATSRATGHLLIGRIFENQVGLPGDFVEAVADFRSGRSRVGGRQGHPGLQGTPHDGFVTQEQAPLSCLT